MKNRNDFCCEHMIVYYLHGLLETFSIHKLVKMLTIHGITKGKPYSRIRDKKCPLICARKPTPAGFS